MTQDAHDRRVDDFAFDGVAAAALTAGRIFGNAFLHHRHGGGGAGAIIGGEGHPPVRHERRARRRRGRRAMRRRGGGGHAVEDPRHRKDGRGERFQSHHWGRTFACGVPVAADTYRVHSHFTEALGPNFRDGARVFDVSAGDAPDAMAVFIPGLDGHAVAGAATELTVLRTVAVETSTLVLQFEASASNAMVSGLTITSDDGAFGTMGEAPIVTATPAQTEEPAAETPVPTPVAHSQSDSDGGVVSTPAPVTPEYTGTVGVQPGQLYNPEDPNDGAHAVPGGPYVAVEEDGSGTARMVLDGSGSHTHFASPEGTPKSVVAFTWSVFETGRILGVLYKLTATFPTGMARRFVPW